MRVVASNDTFEFLELGITDDERRRFMTHNKHILDSRADWVMRLVQSWGHAAAFGDILGDFMCDEGKTKTPVKRIPPAEMVIRICEVVDAAWNEMQHRGWIIDAGSLTDRR